MKLKEIERSVIADALMAQARAIEKKIPADPELAPLFEAKKKKVELLRAVALDIWEGD